MIVNPRLIFCELFQSIDGLQQCAKARLDQKEIKPLNFSNLAINCFY